MIKSYFNGVILMDTARVFFVVVLFVYLLCTFWFMKLDTFLNVNIILRTSLLEMC